MKTLGKIDSLFWIAVGGVGWVLQSKQHDAAIILMVVIIVAGVAGLVGWCVIMLAGGHQAPELAANVGHLMPFLLRASLLAGLGWLGAYAATKAGVKTEELAGLISVVAFGFVKEVVKAVGEPLDALRPAPVGQKSMRRVYGRQFDVQPGETNTAKVNARNAVHADLFQVVDSKGSPGTSLSGWKRKARVARLQLIAKAL